MALSWEELSKVLPALIREQQEFEERRFSRVIRKARKNYREDPETRDILDKLFFLRDLGH